MKLALIGIVFMLYAFFSTLTHAAERPLLAKYNHPGYEFGDDPFVTECAVMRSGHIIRITSEMTADGIENKSETFPLPIPVDQIERMIELAATEKTHKEDGRVCDYGETEMHAYGPASIGEKGVLVLFYSGACGSERIERTGSATAKLIEILGLYCPETLDANRDPDFN